MIGRQTILVVAIPSENRNIFSSILEWISIHRIQKISRVSLIFIECSILVSILLELLLALLDPQQAEFLKREVIKQTLVTLVNAVGHQAQKIPEFQRERIFYTVVVAILQHISPIIDQTTSNMISLFLTTVLFPFSGVAQFLITIIIPLVLSFLLIYFAITNWDAKSLLTYPLDYENTPLIQIYLLIEGSLIFLEVVFRYLFFLPAARRLLNHLDEVSKNPFRYLDRTSGCYKCLFYTQFVALAIIEFLTLPTFALGVYCMCVKRYMVFSHSI